MADDYAWSQLTAKQKDVLEEAARLWLSELHDYVIDGASCDKDRDAYELQAFRIEDALSALEGK